MNVLALKNTALFQNHSASKLTAVENQSQILNFSPPPCKN